MAAERLLISLQKLLNSAFGQSFARPSADFFPLRSSRSWRFKLLPLRLSTLKRRAIQLSILWIHQLPRFAQAALKIQLFQARVLNLTVVRHGNGLGLDQVNTAWPKAKPIVKAIHDL